MTYVPKHTVFTKVAQKLRRFQNVRRLDFASQPPIISVTFDDFPKTAVTIGARELEARGWLGTYYTSAGLMGTTNHHGLQFSAQDLQDLEAKGHEIAGHTHSHVDCTHLSDDELFAQIKENRTALAEMGVKSPIENFAFPFGQMSAALKGQLAPEYKSLRGIRDGVHTGGADLNELLSCGFYSSTAKDVIARIETLAAGDWLTVFTHDIQENPTEWGCTPVEYMSLLSALEKAQNKSAAQILTVRDALKRLDATGGDSHV